MATVRKGILTPPPEWWQHFRPYLKRLFWKRERGNVKRAIRREIGT